MVWAFKAMVVDLASDAFVAAIALVGGFLLLLMAAIYAWFEFERVARLHRADKNWPGSFVVPFVITRQLPGQAGDAAAALGRRRLYLSATGYGLLVADADGVRLLSGWAFATDLIIPRASVERVELGEIAFPLGTAVSVDVLLNTPGGERISIMPMRTSRRFFGNERVEIIELYVEELRRALDLPQARV